LDKDDKDILIILAYKHPKANPTKILYHLNNFKTSIANMDHLIVLGDFNVNHTKPQTFIKEMQTKFQLLQMIHVETTYYHIQLDHIYYQI
jgi:hypothetical protein